MMRWWFWWTATLFTMVTMYPWVFGMAAVAVSQQPQAVRDALQITTEHLQSASVVRLLGVDVSALWWGFVGGWIGVAFSPAMGLWRALVIVPACAFTSWGLSDVIVWQIEQNVTNVPHDVVRGATALVLGLFAPQLIPALRDRIPALLDWAVESLKSLLSRFGGGGGK